MPDNQLHPSDSIIHVLPAQLANKIAAGEVVQRPSSALKELLENAVDAGAGQVQVILKKSGSELVQVVDDGCGMSPEDAARSFKRHATSKLSTAEDLEQICTLGFRGEALASIAAVAQVDLRTRRKSDDVGVFIRVEGGSMITNEPCATPAGTSIAVRNLFYNVPARRNFLKSPATEFKHLVETFQFIALSNPDIGFALIHDDSEVYRLSPADSGMSGHEALRARFSSLFGDHLYQNLVQVNEQTSYLSISGLVSRPEFTRRARGEQYFFVNGRYIKNRSLEHAVVSGYGEMLPRGSYPFFALSLHLDPRHLDVNVHPSKMEIKFDDDRGVYGFVRAVVKKALGAADITPHVGYDDDNRLVEQSVSSRYLQDVHAGAPRLYEQIVPKQKDFFGIDHSVVTQELYGGAGMPRETAPAEEMLTHPGEEVDPSQEIEGERIIWQLHEKYILTRIRSGLMIMDQHAAHERVLYERALIAMQEGKGVSQQLLFPHTLELSAVDHELLKELLSNLRAVGFDIIPLSGRSVMVRGIPADIYVGDERVILQEMLQQYRTYSQTLQIQGRDNLAKSLACRSAIKTGQRLSVQEMRALIDQLFACKMPYACPHGRPTMIKIPIEELDKRFGRIGHLER